MSVVIKVENISKQYRLGQVGTGSLKDDIKRWRYKMMQREDPFLKIGDENDRSQKKISEYVWALKDINFEVKKGEVIGIIGKNGAGKSTLLKILSRTTGPTTGKIKVKGRIASLLEVGTGFHGELSGRENIFLNGAIMGMTKSEIKSRLDEIIDFADVEKYIDTPVKRYSSGMYVRLAFGVAAHLEPDIMIVDEVLAVGDAEFQKKALGKMKDVSAKDGRTVLFVSHNLTAMNSLCTKAIYLQHGKIIDYGNTKDIIHHYLKSESDTRSSYEWSHDESRNDGVARIIRARVINNKHENTEIVNLDEEVGVEFWYEVKQSGFKPIPNIHLFNAKGEYVFVSHESVVEHIFDKGIYQSTMWIPANLLNDGRYTVGIALSTHLPEKVHFYETQALTFDVLEDMNFRTIEHRGKMPGIIRPNLRWKTISQETH